MEYLSLYDYLGKPAGGQLGAIVATEAIKQGIDIKTREIDNPNTQVLYIYTQKIF
jgi:hypothetical protein